MSRIASPDLARLTDSGKQRSLWCRHLACDDLDLLLGDLSLRLFELSVSE